MQDTLDTIAIQSHALLFTKMRYIESHPNLRLASLPLGLVPEKSPPHFLYDKNRIQGPGKTYYPAFCGRSTLLWPDVECGEACKPKYVTPTFLLGINRHFGDTSLLHIYRRSSHPYQSLGV